MHADPTRTQPIGQARADSDRREHADANDPRAAATKAVLKDADRQVAERFEAMGINGDLVLSRIRNGADVDRQTRENWFERDVKTLANANSPQREPGARRYEGCVQGRRRDLPRCAWRDP